MNTALYGLFNDEQLAEQARARLVAAGIKRPAIQLLALSSEERDHVGSYADTEAHMHDAERDHVGSYADTEAHMHNAERDHVGSFAAHRHPDDILRELNQAGLSNSDAQACLMQMAQGARLLLVQPNADQMAQAAEILRA